MITDLFDTTWYLQRYPDVATAGVDPLQHYLQFGRREGRYPCALPALELEEELWQTTDVEPRLNALLAIVQQGSSLDATLAAWVLVRWYGSVNQWQNALPFVTILLQDAAALSILYHQGPFLLAFSTYYYANLGQQAAVVLADPRWPDTADKILAQSMLQSNQSKLVTLNDLFASVTLPLLSTQTPPTLDTVQCTVVPSSWLSRLAWLQPLVTVIMPCFNAGETLATALRSLLNQTHRNLQILVADDASSDNSVAIVRDFASRDSRVKLVQLQQNSGAYAARNAALKLAKGKYITTHDADDWSHPEKIARQLLALRHNKKAVASVSHWVRCSSALEFQRWRMEDGWIYRNVSSLLFHKKVVKQLGFWDRVSVNADTEYYYRIKQQYGPSSIVEVLPGIPLSFGRADSASLSQSQASHLRTQFKGVRKDYHDAAIAWHSNTASLYLAAEPKVRPFKVPLAICRGTPAQQQHNLSLHLSSMQRFDANWYLRCNADVAAAGADPLWHFVRFGAAEGRDPLPDFSLSAYARLVNVPLEQALPHWLQQADATRSVAVFSGEVPEQPTEPAVMLFAHQVSETIFGAERSLLDVVKALSESALNLFVVVPSALNAEYLAALQQYSCKVLVTPYPWWYQGAEAEPIITRKLTELIKRYNINLVYVNTLVLYEPLLAAKDCNVPSIVHVRELPEHDAALCELLRSTAPAIRQHLLELADGFIANSQVVANYLQAGDRCTVIANMVEIDSGLWLPLPTTARLQVAMLSSNLPKKGLDDVIAVARCCMERAVAIDFMLYGPLNSYVTSLQEGNKLPGNVRFCGYTEQASQAIAQAHVVLNLSHFQESFGRSVLEAMASGRVVVAYNWGALPELVLPGCGVLVEFKDTEAVADALQQLQGDRALCEKLAQQARRMVLSKYNVAAVTKQLYQYLIQWAGEKS